ncbi:MAG: methylated-DNA--[protein]-cysteine S-methyltransferase [Rubrivivax sp.]|nr:methylated-DNA--[protein]-cysteine S-methyltransferase [Rubrivivax sp.]
MNRTQDPSAPLVAQCRIATPLGPLTLAATARGLAAALFDAQRHHPGALDVPENPAHPVLVQAAREFADYFAGRRRHFTVPLDPQGTPFQQQVWRALLAIAPGRTTSYGALAAQLGRPAAARAVGAAVGRNPVAIIVPCHRVVGSSGALTGYAGGLPRKRALLALEAPAPFAPAVAAGAATA